MSNRRTPTWLTVLWVTIGIFIAVSVLWFAETSFLSGASSLAVVRKFGYLAFVAGLLIALGLVAFLWWRDHRQDQHRHAQPRKDT